LAVTANDDVLMQTGDIGTGITWHGKWMATLVNLSRSSPWGGPLL
jgi:hypothetical protein